MDVLTLKRYNSWCGDPAQLELIQYRLYRNIEPFWKRFGKSILFTEYGAGSLAGLHSVRRYITNFKSFYYFK